jgi:hypothetical protein
MAEHQPTSVPERCAPPVSISDRTKSPMHCCDYSRIPIHYRHHHCAGFSVRSRSIQPPMR